MRRAGVLARCGAAAALLAVPCAGVGQTTPDLAAQRAESLRLSGRPWHAAETLLAAASREPHLNAAFVVQSARAELRARRYDRARSLLAGQPWLDDYGDGEALGILAEAEARLGAPALAATHFVAGCGRASGSRAALLAVRAGLAFEAAGAPDSAVRYYAIARASGGGTGGGLAAIDGWLRLRHSCWRRSPRHPRSRFRRGPCIFLCPIPPAAASMS